ncbi:M23 family metallopeptidase [Paenibacillus psychroresistens]|uniref:M23 family metallopeptidase n=1 Tax=Paenibacillus psychroresistens TaxID=1778678 RepID=A0A6B8RV56_9BACL|nr:M23 family metallopeptidase [Paenibacillus psychroresistens]QGQ99313.1 M23 family metallopeptidase [Paenibacillus psychroresistens]
MVALLVLPSTFAAGKEEKIKQTLNSAPISAVSDQTVGEQKEKVLPSPKVSEKIVFKMPTSGKVTTPFGYQTHQKILHDGIDIVNKEGTDVYAAAAGKVIKAEYDPDNGFTIVIEHNENWRTEYRHFANAKMPVIKGEMVKSGDLIGHMGSTGQATGPHLHFSILMDGEYIDPVSMLK